MQKKHLHVPLDIKAVDDEGRFSGYGSVFGEIDSYSDIVMPGAFVESLKSKTPALLWQHKADEPIGVWEKAQEDEHGLYLEGRLLINDDPLAKRAHAHLKAGSITGLSIGFYLEDYTWDSDKSAFLLNEIDLWEVSLVTFPANDLARVENVKNALATGQIPRPADVERMLRDAGFSRTQAKTLMASGFSALRDADETGKQIEKLNALIAHMEK